MIIICIFHAYIFCLIGYIKRHKNAKTFSEIFKRFYCKKAFIPIVDIIITINLTFTNVGYVLMITNRLIDVFYYCFKVKFAHWVVAITVSILILFPLSLFKELNFLRVFSFMAFIGTLVMVGTIIYFYFGNFEVEDLELSKYPKSFADYMFTLPLYGGNFDCHSNAVEFMEEYEKNITNKENFRGYVWIVFIAFFIVLGFSLSFGLFSYFTIGNVVKSDVLKSYPLSDVIIIMSLILCYSLIIVYAMFVNSIRTSSHKIGTCILKCQREKRCCCSCCRAFCWDCFEPYIELEKTEEDKSSENDEDDDDEKEQKRASCGVNFLETLLVVGLITFISSFNLPIGKFDGMIWAVSAGFIIYIPILVAIKDGIFQNLVIRWINYLLLLIGLGFISFGGVIVYAMQWNNKSH